MSHDPGETTQFEVTGPGGTGAKVTSKRMTELVAILALLALTANGILTWQLIKGLEALTLTVNARAAESVAKQMEAATAFRELACIQLLPEPERQQCKSIARMQ